MWLQLIGVNIRSVEDWEWIQTETNLMQQVCVSCDQQWIGNTNRNSDHKVKAAACEMYSSLVIYSTLE
jgi:hypothetical protein